MKGMKAVAAALVLQWGLVPMASALDVDAGDFDLIPAGVKIAAVYGQFVERQGLYVDGQRVPGDNRLASQASVLRVGTALGFGDRVVIPQLLLPIVHLEGRGDQSDALGHHSGLGDAILALPTWLLADTARQRYVCFTSFLYLPTGSYDADRALNAGENRYKYDVQIGYSMPWAKGLNWDIGADLILYGDNRDAGQDKLEQRPGWQVQTSWRYRLFPGADLRAGASHLDAGDPRLDGALLPAFEQTKAWVGGSWLFAPTMQIVATYGRDLEVDNGFKEQHRLNFRLLWLL